MKNTLLFLTICISLISCEKMNDTWPASINTDFDTRILDEYFVTSIAFDNEGNAWIGTFKQGLLKYNSNGVTVYNSDNSIISDAYVIHDLAVDSKNNVWIACDGLIKYDGTNFTLYNSSNTNIPEDYVGSVAIDSKDNIWFTSSRFRQGGVVKYDGFDWTVYTPDNSDLPVNFVRSVAIDNDDNVWLALNEIVNDSRIAKISSDKIALYTNSDLGFTPYYLGNIQINSMNQLCGAIDYSLSSSFGNKGPQVFVFNGKTSKKLQYDSFSNVKFITLDNRDNIWCGIYGGYAVYHGDKWTVEDSKFKDSGVFAIEQSFDNKIWIGTGNGIYINN